VFAGVVSANTVSYGARILRWLESSFRKPHDNRDWDETLLMSYRTASRYPADPPSRGLPSCRLRHFLSAAALLAATGLLSSDLQAGTDEPQRLASTVCAACHAVDGNSTNPTYPKLAGQYASYIAKQLREFNGGTRGHDQMSPVAAKLSPEEITEIAAYFSARAPSPGKPGDPAVAELGRAVYLQGNVDAGLPSCDGCHGPTANGGPRFPRLAGQHPAYLAKQLADIKQGRRTSSPLMQAVAERMTDDEMQAVAIFLGGL
jgi:cytochrome c553